MYKKWLSWLVKASISVGICYFLVSNLEIDRFRQKLEIADAGLLAAAFGTVVAQMLLTTLRWSRVLHFLGSGIRFSKAFELILVAQFFGQLLPSSFGADLVRIWQTYRAGIAPVPAANSVILERTAGLFSLALLGLATLPFMLEMVEDQLFRWGILGGIALVTTGCGILLAMASLPSGLTRFRVVAYATELSRQARAVVRRPLLGLYLIALSLSAIIGACLTVYLTATALEVHFAFLSALILVPPVLLVTLLPFSLAGWGIREGAMVVSLGLAGVTYTDAVLVSFCYGLYVLLTASPGAVIWLIARDGTRAAAPARGFSGMPKAVFRRED